MTFITKCDGCGTRIGPDARLGMSGRVEPAFAARQPGSPAGSYGDFHWCEHCAAVACAAVRASRHVPAPSDEERIREAKAEAEDHPGRIITR